MSRLFGGPDACRFPHEREAKFRVAGVSAGRKEEWRKLFPFIPSVVSVTSLLNPDSDDLGVCARCCGLPRTTFALGIQLISP